MAIATQRTARPGPGVQGELAVESANLDIEVVDVDADLATEWLAKNTNNRPVRKRRVIEFRRDMLAGNWRDVGDPLRFNVDGEMIDGQHRLEAIVLASKVMPDIKVPLVVVRGVKNEDHVVIDTGTRRTASDQLRIAGYQNYAILGAAAKWCLLFDRKALYADAMLKSVTHAEIMQYVEDNPDLQDIANEVGRTIGKKCDMPNGYIACGYYLCWRINKGEADEFFGRFADGIGLYEGDPILALRNRLAENRRNHGNLSGAMYLSLLLRAWNAKRENRSLKSLPLERGGQAIPAPAILN